MGAGIWNKIKNFFKDVGTGMQLVFKPASKILHKIPIIGDIAGTLIDGISYLTDPETWSSKPKSEAQSAVGEALNLTDEQLIQLLNPEQQQQFKQLTPEQQQQVLQQLRAAVAQQQQK